MLNALNEPNLYRFFCLSLYRNIYYNVRLRIEDIAKITGEKKGVLKNFNKSMDTILTRKKYPSPINHPVYEFTMRSLYKIPAMDYKGFITLSHKFTQVKLSVKVKGHVGSIHRTCYVLTDVEMTSVGMIVPPINQCLDTCGLMTYLPIKLR